MFENWVLNNRYMIVKEIAQGGFATIYKGWDMNLKKIVAVKKIHSHFASDAKFVDMFRKEALNTARFDHQNIVKVINFLKDAAGNYYIILEYVKGVSLDHLIEKALNTSYRFPEKIALYIMRETAAALQYVCDLTDESTGVPLNIIHRDISPGNIMIYYNGRVKLTDFGIATGATTQRKSRQGKLLGKFSYMSPEQAFGDIMDTRSDLFSLGIVLYEVLTGKKLYDAASELEILAKVKSVRIDLRSLASAGISDGTIEILGKMLEKSPDKRYQTPQELVDAIDSFLGGPPDAAIMDEFTEINKNLLSAEWSHIRADIEAESTGSLDVLEKYALNEPPPLGSDAPSPLGESKPVPVSPYQPPSPDLPPQPSVPASPPIESAPPAAVEPTASQGVSPGMPQSQQPHSPTSPPQSAVPESPSIESAPPAAVEPTLSQGVSPGMPHSQQPHSLSSVPPPMEAPPASSDLPPTLETPPSVSGEVPMEGAPGVSMSPPTAPHSPEAGVQIPSSPQPEVAPTVPPIQQPSDAVPESPGLPPITHDSAAGMDMSGVSQQAPSVQGGLPHQDVSPQEPSPAEPVGAYSAPEHVSQPSPSEPIPAPSLTGGSQPPFAEVPMPSSGGEFQFEDGASAAPAAGPQMAGISDGEKEKTVFDFVLDTAHKYKKLIISGALAALAAFIIYSAIDTFLQLTPYGVKIHNMVWPPAMIIDSIPSGADISVERDDSVDIITADGYSSVTPSDIKRIPPGVYTLRLRKSGYGTIERRITVLGAKKGEQNISIADAKIDGNMFTVPFEVMLELDSVPEGAEVYIGGRRVGETPYAGAMSIGRYNIRLTHEGYEPLGSDSPDPSAVGVCFLDTSLPVDAQTTVDRRFWTLEEGRAEGDMKGYSVLGMLWKQISINSVPSGAAVYINEDYRGDTPLDAIPVPSGEHNIKMTRSGYNRYSRTINIGEDESDSISAYLSRNITIQAYAEGGSGDEDLNANVTIKGTNIRGTTPLRVTLPARTYTFIVDKEPGYQQLTVSRNVSGLPSTFKVNLERRHPYLSLTLRDYRTNERVPDAMVWVNGNYWRRTNALGLAADYIEQPPGEFSVEVQADGHPPHRMTLWIERGERKEAEVSLGAPRDGAIVVDATEGYSGVLIYVNGEYMGEELQQVTDLARSQHTVEMRGGGLAEPVQLRVKISEPNQLLIVKLIINSMGEPELVELAPDLYWELYN